jgi:SAM-dependent methyltransferase
MAPSELDQSSAATRKRWDSRYSEGVTPWDTQTTPPEVVDFWAGNRLVPNALALDLGCGPGTNVRYLARLGLTTIGVEIASAPLITAHQRIERYEPDIRARAHFVCADVCRVPFVGLNAAYILDVGCLHSLPRAMRPYYVQSVVNNLAPGGYYHLYAFDADPENPDPPSGPVGMLFGEVAQRFAPSLTVVEEIIAMPDRRPCRWYLLQRPASQ